MSSSLKSEFGSVVVLAVTDLHVSVDEPVELEVFVVVAEGVDQLFGDLHDK